MLVFLTELILPVLEFFSLKGTSGVMLGHHRAEMFIHTLLQSVDLKRIKVFYIFGPQLSQLSLQVLVKYSLSSGFIHFDH